MKYLLIILVLATGLQSTLSAQKAGQLCYELRIYTAEKGKLNDLLKRFRNHTVALFEKHGMTNVGYWTPLDNPEEKLYYVLSYPSRQAREAAWQGFMADTTWQRVWKDSEVNGKLIAGIESIFLKTTDFSPNDLRSECGKVWEFRIYTASPGNLNNLLARFRNHTLKLFKKHGMKNKIYWTPTDEEQGRDSMLYYFLAHDSEPAGKASFSRFGKDPKWISARGESEKNAGGSLTLKVQSIYMYPTDFSPLK